jgi:hypothetical protein
VWRSPTAFQRHKEIENQLGGHSFEVRSPLCDSLNAIANREDPVAPVDSSNWRR